MSGSPFTGLSGTSYSVTGLSSFLTYTYTVTAVGDGTNYNNSDPSSVISATTTDPNAVNSINPVFGDGSWSSLTSSFGTASINGYDFVQANITSANYYGSKGEKHTTYIGLDKLANGGKITMPTVNSVSQIEIHAATGTAERTFTLKEYNTTTSAWDLVGTYTYNTASKNSGLDSVYVLSVTRSAPSKFRIENAGAGSMSVMQIITRTSPTSILSTPTGIQLHMQPVIELLLPVMALPVLQAKSDMHILSVNRQQIHTMLLERIVFHQGGFVYLQLAMMLLIQIHIYPLVHLHLVC